MTGSLLHPLVDWEASGDIRLSLGRLFAAEERHTLRNGFVRLHFALAEQAGSLAESAVAREFLQAHTERSAVLSMYAPFRRHVALFAGGVWDEWLDPRLLTGLLEDGTTTKLTCSPSDRFRGLARELMPGIFEVPAFTADFSALLREEVERFVATTPEQLLRRPNNHHHHGVLAVDIGLEPLLLALLRRALAPLARAIFPVEGAELDSLHGFFVRYGLELDHELENHHDDADVTFNLALDFDREVLGAELNFCGLLGHPDHRQYSGAYRHRPGHAVVHLGRHRHGVQKIQSGSRLSLVVWARSSAFRIAGQGGYERESSAPDERCLSRRHDVDFARYSKSSASPSSTAWCPPRGFAHDDG